MIAPYPGAERVKNNGGHTFSKNEIQNVVLKNVLGKSQ